MPEVLKKNAGTVENDFSVGTEEHGIKVDSGSNEIALYDPVNGTKKLSDLGGGTAEFDRLLFNTDGGLIYDSSGEILLRNP